MKKTLSWSASKWCGMNKMCMVCFRHCRIPEGENGFCGGRSCLNGEIVLSNYGRLTALALDPVEKKPLARFFPGHLILSAGSYGCNLACPFCQNYEIAMHRPARPEDENGHRFRTELQTQYFSPEELAETAFYYRKRGNIGIAFTYNEPLIGWEYILDTARFVRAKGMKTVLVTNGTAERNILLKILPWIDAMNIDLKGFSDDFYRSFVHGSFDMTKRFIETAVRGTGEIPGCHVEITTLIIPGKNDTSEMMRAEAEWLASLDSGKGEIPLHVTRYFPRYRCSIPATPVKRVYELAAIAGKYLKYVYTGNC